MLEAAREWADALPTDLTVGNPDGGGSEGVSWKKFKKGDKFEPFRSRGKGDTARDDELLKTWSEYFLYAHGIIAMVKEGVFINESLNQLKQFLLKRAGRIESLLHLMGETGHTAVTNPATVVPDTNDPELPVLNDWDYDKLTRRPSWTSGLPDQTRGMTLRHALIIRSSSSNHGTPAWCVNLEVVR
jgi:hypothetical protein